MTRIDFSYLNATRTTPAETTETPSNHERNEEAAEVEELLDKEDKDYCIANSYGIVRLTLKE